MQKDYIDEEKLKVKPEDEKGPELRGDKRILKETHCCVALWLIILFVCSIYLLLIKKKKLDTNYCDCGSSKKRVSRISIN